MIFSKYFSAEGFFLPVTGSSTWNSTVPWLDLDRDRNSCFGTKQILCSELKRKKQNCLTWDFGAILKSTFHKWDFLTFKPFAANVAAMSHKDEGSNKFPGTEGTGCWAGGLCLACDTAMCAGRWCGGCNLRCWSCTKFKSQQHTHRSCFVHPSGEPAFFTEGYSYLVNDKF